jgi:CheY-like chemotaxis protein
VLHNLVGNAVKFTEAGHVSVLISGSPEELVFEVCDTGPGVTPEDARDLFQHFGLRDASTTRRHGGSGLGLAIARGLAELMDGEVTVRSTPGEGSVFTARLRLSEAVPAPAAQPPALKAAAAGPRLRVLAAEDNPTNQLVLRTLLEQVGVDVHIVADGEAALAAWRAAAWDLVLMDIQMPKMDGVAAARAIRAWEAVERRARTPIVAVTANGSAEEAAEYMAVGMDGVAPKPIQLGQLVAVIADVTSRAAAPAGAGRSAA